MTRSAPLAGTAAPLPADVTGAGSAYLTLGPFAVRADGTLAPRDAEAPPALRFAWRGRDCGAALEPGRLRLASIAARIPSTADGAPRRGDAFATLHSLPPRLPPGWRLALLPDHRIRLEAEAPLDAPPTATTLIAALVRFALALDPYLDSLESTCGTTSPAGSASTCPG